MSYQNVIQTIKKKYPESIVEEGQNSGQKEITLTPKKRALLLTDGSLTILLEAFAGSEIKISGLKQKTIPANEKLADELKINSGEELNEREVILSAEQKPLVYARSYGVISRLSKGARNDILNTDIPIGKILKKHKVEMHREIKEIGIISNAKIAKILNLSNNNKILWRSYTIIQKNVPLMKIEEYFGKV